MKQVMDTTVSKKEIDFESIYKKHIYYSVDKEEHWLIDQFKVFGDPAFYGALSEGWTCAEYFSTGNKHSYVCTIAHDETELSVDVYSDGAVKYVHYRDKYIIRNANDMFTYGFNTQKAFDKAIEDGILIIENNSWFDLYSSWNQWSGDSEEFVSHDLLEDAIPNAAEVLVNHVKHLYNIIATENNNMTLKKASW